MAIAYHGAIAWSHATRHGEPLVGLLDHWDASHYTTIIQDGGHYGLRRAFFPLYPACVAILHRWFGGPIPWVGTLFSSFCLVLFVAWASTRRQGKNSPLLSSSKWGWFLLLFSPASFALHTHHTEGLFLLLSFGALAWAAERRLWAAGLLCGLSVWTRNQGVFVTAAAAALATGGWREPGTWRRFASVAGIGFVAFLLLLLFEYRTAGHPLAFLQAQSHWTHARSVTEVARTFWFGNPWQATNDTSVARHLFFFALLGALPFVWRSNRPLGLYCALSLLPLPLQGELINTFRFGAVLFPFFFWAGDRLARESRWLPWAIAPGWLGLNHWVTLEYFRAHWAY